MILWIACLTILISTINSLNYTTQLANTTRVSVAKSSGDFKIGALVSVRLHSPGKKNTRNLECGKIREHYGIQRVEVIFQTIDKINNDPNLLKNIKLGVEIRDTCWYAPIALQHTIDLIQESITSPYGVKNAAAPNHRQCSNSTVTDSPLIAVAGPASSSIALQVQNLLQLFSIPQIGYSATSKDLSDKARFSTFMRVVPSDYYQAQVMIDIVKHNNWTYIHTVHTDENYGQSGIQAFRELADKNGICIAREDSILSNDEDEKFQELMNNLKEDENANVIVCFCEGMTIRGMLMAIKHLNLTNRFLIIGTEGWADRQDVVNEYEMQAVGSISIRIHSKYVKSFDEYYFARDPFNNSRNVWFREFWEDKFHCKMPATKINEIVTRTTPTTTFTYDTESDWQTGEFYDNDTDYTSSSPSQALPSTAKPIPFCTGNEDITKNHKQEPKLNFLIKAIYTLAYGLQAYHEDVCGKDFDGVCPQLSKSFNHSKFFNILMNVSFTTEEKENVEFNQDGDVTAHYDIMNFQQMPNGTFAYVKIGDWDNHSLSFSNEFKPPTGNGSSKFSSVCSKACNPGFYKLYQVTGGVEASYCCWMCVECEENEYLINETLCQSCAKGSWPNHDKTECVENPIEILAWTDTESVISTGSSVLGMSLSALVLMIFIRFNNTPVVKASTRELCYIVLVGMILSHISVFAILAYPNENMCLLSRLLPGISFAMIYGSLLIKTNRIARLLAISKKRFPSKKLKFMSSLSQVVIALILISIEVLIAVTILFIEPPTTELKYPRNNLNLLVCRESPTTIITPLAFIFLLIILCTYYAFKTRNVPENFNETKFVGFAIYTTCVIWIAFFPIYYGSEMQIVTKCLCISLSSITTLIFLFIPKIYIILLHPERNIRALFTTSKSIRCHIGASHHSNISNKNSSSLSSFHGQSSLEHEQTLNRTRSMKKSTYCQTSAECLSIFKADASCSPVRDEQFEFLFPEHVYLEQYPHEILTSPYTLLKNSDYRRIPQISPSHVKLRRDIIYAKENGTTGNGRLHHAMKPHRAKHHLKPTRKSAPILCAECLEVERQKSRSLNVSSNSTDEKSPIFTVEKIPIENSSENSISTLGNGRRKIAISEESLSECSIEESSLSCKLKKITIQLT